eukprot:788198-Ditylum_brightwellii.AAC.1
MAASHNVLAMQINSIRARIENIERENCIPGTLVTMGPTNTDKKRQKSTNPVCNTPNVIMGLQYHVIVTPSKQHELCPRHRRTAD